MSLRTVTLTMALLGAALLAACGPKKSPQTRQYLQNLDSAIAPLNQALAQEKLPAAPQMPALSKTPSAAEEEALQKFSVELAAYDEAVSRETQRVLALCDQTQSKIRGLDATDVDPAAADLANGYVGLTDRRQQLAVDLSAFLAAQQAELKKGLVVRYAARLTAAAAAALLSSTDGAGASAFEPTAEEKAEMNSQAKSVQEAVASWIKDAGAVASSRRDTLSALKSQYPGEDWSAFAR